ncbi:stage II sporulation protein R [Paenibacillus mesophilus]|uniref:stage II sporulation protein R n=1 Tax=Paenibacillus mesophilus TaxID=2582849 RepID=UPI00110E0D56|nr:stage II sporulation protein R [Paenibacillus mesophilus]TMV47114.1 stage II sporulation protein R [Paenibacillus mesophilus]
MVKRQSFRSYWIVAFALIVMMTCWESNRTQAAVLDSAIPEESIRLRILANSDAPNDQLVKRILRDEVIRQMSEWVTEPEGIAAARNAVNRHIGDLEALVGNVLAQNGYDYAYTVEIGQVPFPAKIYGNKVYPAGDYEALRITLGKGEGQNWWCVLFPPLCFVDGKAGVAVAKKNADATKTTKASAQAAASAPAAEDAPKVEVKFFLGEVLSKAVSFVKGLLA